MSKIKTLSSQHPELSFSLLDAVKMIDPSGDKRTYCEVISKLIQNKFNERYNEHRINDYISDLKREYEMTEFDYPNSNNFSLILFCLMLNEFIGLEVHKSIKKLHEYREKKLINADITKYNSVEEIYNDITVAEIKSVQSELYKMVELVFEDNEWLLIRPLTYESSKKYGSGTKWCTTSATNDEYFYKYFQGILIYVINKKNGLKVGVHAELEKGIYNNISFWNQKDERIDSLDSGLPPKILKKIKEELTGNLSNRHIAELKGFKTEYYSQKEEYLLREFAVNDTLTPVPIDPPTIRFEPNTVANDFRPEAQEGVEFDRDFAIDIRRYTTNIA